MAGRMRYPLGVLLGRAQARYIAECEARLAAAGFSDLAIAHGTNVLRHLRPGEPTRVGDLVQRSGVTKQAVSQQLRYLQDHGYVVLGPDPADRRGKFAALTERGAESQRSIREIFSEVHRDWWGRYGDERMTALIETLGEISGLDGDG